MAVQKKGTKQITANKKARHDYFVEEAYECGIELFGTEVKSIRQGTVSLNDSYCIFRDGNKDPLRERKLLMHKKEIMTLFGKTKQQGYSLIPLSLYFKNARVKVELGLCKGKKLYDKREAAAQRDAKREIERAMKARR